MRIMALYNKTMASIFSRIINGELPAYKVHEDDKTLAIMDINPIQKGQILVVPKTGVSFIWDMNSEDYQALMATVKQAGIKIREIFPDKARVGVIIEGLEVVDHAHVKVFPFSTASEFHHLPDPKEAPSMEELQQLAQRLAF